MPLLVFALWLCSKNAYLYQVKVLLDDYQDELSTTFGFRDYKVTVDSRIKKQGFYFYKACWSKEPFVYICGKKFTKYVLEKIDIKIYSNQKQVTLWVNGEFVETQFQNTIFQFKEVFISKQFNEIIVKPIAMDNPPMAKRMSSGGSMSFASIWNHIKKQR